MAKKNYFSNLNVRNVTDNKQFWKTVKPLFSRTAGDNERITLIEGVKVISKDREVAETFKSYFETIVENLGINSTYLSEEPVSNESANDIIRKFKNHSGRQGICSTHLTLCLTLNFIFGYCSRACPDLKIIVYSFCWFLLVT